MYIYRLENIINKFDFYKEVLRKMVSKIINLFFSGD